MASAVPADKKLYASIRENVKRKAKSRWPSAYLSALVVRKYKDEMKKRGKSPYEGSGVSRKGAALTRWFDEKWVDVSTKKPCGSAKTRGYYPACRPSVRVSKGTPITIGDLDEAQLKRMAKKKQLVKGRTATYEFTRGR